jgi:hypothetical protein
VRLNKDLDFQRDLIIHRKGAKNATVLIFSEKMFFFPDNCQFGYKFWIRPDDADAFLVNKYPKCSPGTRMEPLARPGMSSCGDGKPSP